MNCNLPKITYPTLRSLLLLKICEAISLEKDVEVANHAIEKPDFQTKLRDIRLLAPSQIVRKVKSETSVAAYASSIALKLGAESIRTSVEIADQIVHFVKQSPSNCLGEEVEKLLLRDLTVSTTETGRLTFEFGDRAIAAYLHEIFSHCALQLTKPSDKLIFKPDKKTSNNSKVFLCQYSYARCSALIRMKFTSICIGKSVGNDSAIWLKKGKLLLQKELNLMTKIVSTLDDWEEKPPLTLAIALSEAFQQFYRDCQIVKDDTLELQVAQCRLALVMITHWLLKQLLEQGIGVLAPETL